MKSKTFKKQLQKPYPKPKSYSEQSIIEQKNIPKIIQKLQTCHCSRLVNPEKIVDHTHHILDESN